MIPPNCIERLTAHASAPRGGLLGAYRHTETSRLLAVGGWWCLAKIIIMSVDATHVCSGDVTETRTQKHYVSELAPKTLSQSEEPRAMLTINIRMN